MEVFTGKWDVKINQMAFKAENIVVDGHNVRIENIHFTSPRDAIKQLSDLIKEIASKEL